jgi:hypothetical protein
MGRHLKRRVSATFLNECTAIKLNDTGKRNSIMVCEQKGAQAFEDEKECGYWMVYEKKVRKCLRTKKCGC